MAVNIKRGHALSNLSMTPLIDVVFLLLIFFLVATRFEEEERSMEIRLPEASEAVPLTVKPKEVFINVTKDGRFIVARRPLSEEQLVALLKQAAASNPGRQGAVIRADQGCEWQVVVRAVNACVKAGIKEYTTTTSEPTP